MIWDRQTDLSLDGLEQFYLPGKKRETILARRRVGDRFEFRLKTIFQSNIKKMVPTGAMSHVRHQYLE